MQLSLYRSERPEVFEDIIGQKHIVRILQNQIRTGTVSQAYLFSGTHGTGKTSTARILAKAVNCLNADGEADNGPVPCGDCENCRAIRDGRFIDCIELDAASNNGVDDLRAIIEMVKYPPTVGRYKVYIIDEVHMLSQAAENAFLKTLEEPPAHAIFILATTDPQKVRSTIRSRCMQLNFRRVTEEELAAGMQRICNKRGIEVTRDALMTIASRADGSVRDALSILEQCIAGGDTRLDRSLVLEYTGAAGEDFFLALTGAVAAGNIGKALIYIDEIIRRGKDAKQILKDWLEHYRDLMVVKYVGRPERIIRSSAENIGRLKAQADGIELADIEKAIRTISEYINTGRYSDRPRILLETCAVRLAGGIGFDNSSSNSLSNSSAAPVRTRPARQVSVQPESAPEMKPAAPAEPQYEEPIDMIASLPREKAGDPVRMWNNIVDVIAREDRSFVSLVGKQSCGMEFESGELIVNVRPGKLRIATDKIGDITRAARSLYGSEVFVTLRAGNPEANAAEPEVSEQEVSRVIDSDADISDMVSDVENLFGIKPEVTN